MLKAGDRILKINWSDMTQASQMEALSRLKASEDVCTLEIEYDVTLHRKEGSAVAIPGVFKAVGQIYRMSMCGL